MLNKKAITILGAIFLLIVGTLGFLIYQNLGKNTEQEQVANDQASPSPAPEPTPAPAPPTPPVILPKAIKLTDEQVISPALFYQGNGVAYFNKQGQLFQVDIQESGGQVYLSNKRELTIPLKPGVSKILWPLAGNNFISEFQNFAKKTWSVYVSDQGGYTDLPPQVTGVQWMPGGDKILYLWLDSHNKTTLNIANPDNSNYQTIVDIWENDDALALSPDGKTLLYYRTQNTDPTNAIIMTTPDGGIFRSIVKTGYNMGVSWSLDSKQFLFARRDTTTQKYKLWTGNIATDAVKDLGVFSVVEKTVWSRDANTIFVAVPSKGDPDKGLTEDMIYKINVITGEKKSFDPGTAVDARELFLSANEDKLFFKSLQDGALYYMEVSK